MAHILKPSIATSAGEMCRTGLITISQGSLPFLYYRSNRLYRSRKLLCGLLLLPLGVICIVYLFLPHGEAEPRKHSVNVETITEPQSVQLSDIRQVNTPGRVSNPKSNFIFHGSKEIRPKENGGMHRPRLQSESDELHPGLDHKVLGATIAKWNRTDSIGRPKSPQAPRNPQVTDSRRGSDRNNISLFTLWLKNQHKFCSGNFVAFANEFALISNVLINTKRMRYLRKGGEDMEKVLQQSEEEEYITFRNGCFLIHCNHRPLYSFHGRNKNHLNSWLENTSTKHNYITEKTHSIIKTFTIAVTRYEYANLYHTMTDWYNAFLLMRFFNVSRSKTDILFVDAHPKGSLDVTWAVLFNSSIRVGELTSLTQASQLAWGILGYNSPLSDFHITELPLVEDFRDFFLRSHNIEPTGRLDCSKLSILFIWRRDYVAHPRNPQGIISRKFANEDEMLQSVSKRYPQHNVLGVQLDKYDMTEQLRLISETDILIGMHGAALTHALFLPKHAALLEFAPAYLDSGQDHFASIARWRKLHYEKWKNTEQEFELLGQKTIIPTEVLLHALENMIGRLCDPDSYPHSSHSYMDVNIFALDDIKPTDNQEEKTDDYLPGHTELIDSNGFKIMY